MVMLVICYHEWHPEYSDEVHTTWLSSLSDHSFYNLYNIYWNAFLHIVLKDSPKPATTVATFPSHVIEKLSLWRVYRLIFQFKLDQKPKQGIPIRTVHNSRSVEIYNDNNIIVFFFEKINKKLPYLMTFTYCICDVHSTTSLRNILIKVACSIFAN